VNNTLKSAEYLNGKDCNQGSWFCVQTHPKHEHIAARCLVKAGKIKVFNPQMRIHRATKRGSVWFTESAFPGYIFAQFDLQTQLDMVRYSSGVSKVVQFNSIYPSIPDFQVDELLAVFGDKDTLVFTPQLTTGDTVRIISGAFHDLLAVVQFIQPAKQRLRALLEFLGRMTSVELDIYNVTVEQPCQAAHHPLCRI
jgi:transcriptional antiterminator RfaH